MNNYTIIHLHTPLSNAFTTMDSITNYKLYVDKAKENGMKAMAFTEHGNVMEWVHKKNYCEENGIKYIHGTEAYVTETLEEKIRDNYHVVLLARNYEGVKEINLMMSHKFACNRADGHFYYNPRITFDELINTSDNVIITTACLGGILGKGHKDIKIKFTKFLMENKHRCFLELQHHNVSKQIEYNKELLNISAKTGIRIVLGTDTHSLNEEHAEGRIVLQKSKGIHFDNEDGWDLTFKTYDELRDILDNYDYLSSEIVDEMLNNTNVIADMVEEFTLDKSNKYPKLHDNPNDIFKEKVMEGASKFKINKLPNFKEYKDRIKYEYDVMSKNGSIDYMLLEEDVKKWCRENDKPYGYSRGSVSGSLMAYLLEITKVDSIRYDMNFERFMNPSRISLCDIDTDYPANVREDVKNYLYSKEEVNCSEIVTFNTIALKGAINDVGRALNMPLEKVRNISKNIESKEKKFREEYPKLFKYVDLLQGTVVSVGVHPAGTIVYDGDLASELSTFTSTTCPFPISQVNMKEVDSLNYVKLDILGLDTVGIVHETCKLAGIDELVPDNMDYDDDNVWDDIKKSSFGIFQWESATAFEYYKKLFNVKTLERIYENNPGFKKIDLFSIGNGAIRPAGDSYREELASGKFKDNGHEILNEFLAPTLGFLVFQEQIIEFLNKFCGYTLSDADMVRRGFSKKSGTEQFIPIIKKGFIKTMGEKYNVPVEEAEVLIVDFIQVIIDASDYLFSLNHSFPYSAIGYACAWLRYYYPLEFLTSKLNYSIDDINKTHLAIDYIKEFTDISIKSATFRYSKSKYFQDRPTNSIYKGIESVKGFGAKLNVYDEISPFYEKEYDNFIQLLDDISTTRLGIGKIRILLEVDFFKEFGNMGYLGRVLEMYDKYGSAKVLSKKKFTAEELELIIPLGRETKSQIKDFDLGEFLQLYASILPKDDLIEIDKIKLELKHLGYINTISDKYDNSFYIVSLFEHKYKHPMLTLTQINSGESTLMKCKVPVYSKNPIVVGDVIKIIKQGEEGKWSITERGGFIQSKTDFELCLQRYSLVKFTED